LFFKDFDLVLKGMSKKAKLYGLIPHTPFFIKSSPFSKVPLLKVDIRLFALFFVGPLQHKN
jgi:hypothetical protein